MRLKWHSFPGIPGLLLALVAGCVLADGGSGSHAVSGPQDSLAVSQAALGRQVGSYTLLDTAGQPFAVDSLRGRPMVVSLIYTSCHHVCPMLTERVAQVVDIAREALGDASFTVLTVGFDTAVDSPERMRQFAAQRNISDPNWHFLSSDEATLAALVADVGFVYFPSPKGFDHLSQTTVLDADGRVYRQVYGDTFATQALVEPLKELILGAPVGAGMVEGWLDNVRLFCTVYDPASGRYRFDYSIFVSAFIGILCLGGVAIFVLRSWRDAA